MNKIRNKFISVGLKQILLIITYPFLKKILKFFLEDFKIYFRKNF